MRAKLLDEVAAIGEAMIPPCERYPIMLSWYRGAACAVGAVDINDEFGWLFSLADPADRSNASLEAFWRTLLRDRGPDQRRPAPDAFWMHFISGMSAALRGNPLTQLGAETLEPKNPMRLWVREAWVRDWPPLVLCLPDGDEGAFMEHSQCSALDSQIFVTRAGCMGLGPAPLEVRNKVAIFSGASQVFLLRGREGPDFRLVRYGYVHGLMDRKGVSDGGRFRGDNSHLSAGAESLPRLGLDGGVLRVLGLLVSTKLPVQQFLEISPPPHQGRPPSLHGLHARAPFNQSRTSRLPS